MVIRRQMNDAFPYNVHEITNNNKFGPIINSFSTEIYAKQYADIEKKATGKNYVVVRGSLVAVYFT